MDVHALDADTFVRDYMSIRRPVIIKGALDGWQVQTTWTPQSLATRYAERAVAAGPIPYSNAFGIEGGTVELGGFQAYMAKLPAGLVFPTAQDAVAGRPRRPRAAAAATEARAARATADLIAGIGKGQAPPAYIFDTEVLRFDPDFFDQERNRFPDALAPLAAGLEGPPTMQFFYGPALSGAPYHFHGDAVNALVRGRKRWLLLAPAHAVYSKAHPASAGTWPDFVGAKGYPTGDGVARTGAAVLDLDTDRTGPDRSAAAPYVCTQEAGDLVYVPAMWGHATVNEADAIGCAFEYDRERVV